MILVLEVNRDSPEVFCKLCQPRVVADGFWARFGVGHSLAWRVGAAGGQHPAQGRVGTAVSSSWQGCEEHGGGR